jgi:hypothetical protein
MSDGKKFAPEYLIIQQSVDSSIVQPRILDAAQPCSNLHEFDLLTSEQVSSHSMLQ